MELDRASREELLRVPGIGPKAADAILAARRRGRITHLSHLRALGVRDVQKAAPFVLLDGRPPAHQMELLTAG